MTGPGRLDGRVALVTGAGAGLGRAYGRLLAARGARVLVHDIDAAGAAETVRRIAAVGGAATALVNDITDTAELARCLDSAGPIDVLVNNAGIDQARLTEEVTEADFDRMFAVHVRGTFFATRAVVPGMKARRAGSIVNIASINAMIADDTDPHYCAAKAAILGLTKAWAREFAPWGIRVNAVAPGHVLTAGGTLARGAERIHHIAATRIPFGRYAAPEEIAPLIGFLAADDSAFVTGQVISACGGEAIVGI